MFRYLQAVAVLRFLAHHIQHRVHQLGSCWGTCRKIIEWCNSKIKRWMFKMYMYLATAAATTTSHTYV